MNNQIDETEYYVNLGKANDNLVKRLIDTYGVIEVFRRIVRAESFQLGDDKYTTSNYGIVTKLAK